MSAITIRHKSNHYDVDEFINQLLASQKFDELAEKVADKAANKIKSIEAPPARLERFNDGNKANKTIDHDQVLRENDKQPENGQPNSNMKLRNEPGKAGKIDTQAVMTETTSQSDSLRLKYKYLTRNAYEKKVFSDRIAENVDRNPVLRNDEHEETPKQNEKRHEEFTEHVMKTESHDDPDVTEKIQHIPNIESANNENRWRHESRDDKHQDSETNRNQNRENPEYGVNAERNENVHKNVYSREEAPKLREEQIQRHEQLRSQEAQNARPEFKSVVKVQEQSLENATSEEIASSQSVEEEQQENTEDVELVEHGENMDHVGNIDNVGNVEHNKHTGAMENNDHVDNTQNYEHVSVVEHTENAGIMEHNEHAGVMEHDEHAGNLEDSAHAGNMELNEDVGNTEHSEHAINTEHNEHIEKMEHNENVANMHNSEYVSKMKNNEHAGNMEINEHSGNMELVEHLENVVPSEETINDEVENIQGEQKTSEKSSSGENVEQIQEAAHFRADDNEPDMEENKVTLDKFEEPVIGYQNSAENPISTMKPIIRQEGNQFYTFVQAPEYQEYHEEYAKVMKGKVYNPADFLP